MGDKQPEQSIRRELMDRSDPVSRILDLADDAIITIDQHGAIETFNPAAEELFGFSAAEVIAPMVPPQPTIRASPWGSPKISVGGISWAMPATFLARSRTMKSWFDGS